MPTTLIAQRPHYTRGRRLKAGDKLVVSEQVAEKLLALNTDGRPVFILESDQVPEPVEEVISEWPADQGDPAEYLEKFPEGPHAALAQTLVESGYDVEVEDEDDK